MARLSRAAFLRGTLGLGAVLAGGSVSARSSTMRTRPIPKSKEAVPVVGMGTWQTFDVVLDQATRTTLSSVLGELFSAGGTVIDSSPMYGRAEKVVGQLLTSSPPRSKPFLATKVWTRGQAAGIRQMNRSLRRFQVRQIDLLQIHNLLDWRAHLDTLRAWKQEGRIRTLGITHYRRDAFDDLAAIMKAEPIDFVQLPYSIALRETHDRLLPLAADRGVAVLVNRPFEGGALFGKVRGKRLPAWASDFECLTWAQFFLKYILSCRPVTCVIPATGNPEHMRDDARAGFGRLPNAKQRRRMEQFFDAL